MPPSGERAILKRDKTLVNPDKAIVGLYGSQFFTNRMTIGQTIARSEKTIDVRTQPFRSRGRDRS